MNKYLIFDWGGVFTHGHLLREFSANLSAKCGRDKDEIEKVFRQFELPYETGKVSPEQFWTDFLRELNLNLPIGEVREVFLNSYSVNREMLDFVFELKKTHSTILLTNNYADVIERIKIIFELDKYFDRVYSSSEIGCKKPEKAAYEYVLNDLKIEPEQAVFIDDKEKNVVGAQNVRIPAILFENVEQLKLTLEKLP